MARRPKYLLGPHVREIGVTDGFSDRTCANRRRKFNIALDDGWGTSGDLITIIRR